MGNPATFEHYNFYPVCGFCMNVWDMIYQRVRTRTSAAQWLSYCHHDGCDPDVHNYINKATGWPKGWKVSRRTGLPNWSTLPPLPETDDRVFHKRATDGPHAKWRKTTQALMNKAQAYRAELRGVAPEEMAEFESDTPEEPLVKVDLSDPDLW